MNWFYSIVKKKVQEEPRLIDVYEAITNKTTGTKKEKK